MGTTALALCLLAGNSWAAPQCASPQEMIALRVAAMRQQLMVAALTCHQAGSFNRFVTTYEQELQVSDHELMRFFVRQDSARADDAYNAYKTKMANDSSLRSLNDPWFCGTARASLREALDRNPPLAELVSEDARPIRTGFANCMADGTDQGAPNAPSRHRYLLDNTPTDSNSPMGTRGQLSVE